MQPNRTLEQVEQSMDYPNTLNAKPSTNNVESDRTNCDPDDECGVNDSWWNMAIAMKGCCTVHWYLEQLVRYSGIGTVALAEYDWCDDGAGRISLNAEFKIVMRQWYSTTYWAYLQWDVLWHWASIGAWQYLECLQLWWDISMHCWYLQCYVYLQCVVGIHNYDGTHIYVGAVVLIRLC